MVSRGCGGEARSTYVKLQFIYDYGNASIIVRIECNTVMRLNQSTQIYAEIMCQLEFKTEIANFSGMGRDAN